MRHYIPKAQDLLDEIWKDKDVNIVEKNYTLRKDKFSLFDLSLRAYGQDEDKEYVRSAFYRANIRRGNTIIKNVRKGTEDWARKGTPKILDIKLDYPKFFNNKAELSNQDRNIAEIIFEGVNLAFKEGKRVQLILTEKVNGQNAQVSYNYDYDAWIICSKNVSILASNPDDFRKYEESRYKYAILIGQQWFKSISHLKQGQIKNLKKLLDGYTIIGEYCGNPLYQHMVRYEQISIKWFAMVDNYSEDYCKNPFVTQKQLEKFGFKTAKMKSLLTTSSQENFYNTLQKFHLKTSEAGLQNDQYGMEGSIAYFLVHQIDKNGHGKPRTVGAGKLKTLEYRFFRKIREKISRFIAKKEIPAQLIKKFKNQITELEKSNLARAPFPHEYYVKILKGGIQLVENTQIKEQFFKSHYISVLKVIFYALYKRISFKKFGSKMLQDQNFIEKVSEISFSKYNGLGCSTKIIYIPLCLPGMFKTYLGKKIAPHFEKLGISYTIIPFNGDEAFFSNLQQIFTQQSNQEQKKQKQSSSLSHYFLDGSFDIESLFSTLNQIKKLSLRDDSHYKFILIRDQVNNEQVFESKDGNKYPFKVETIFMNYYGQHSNHLNVPKIKDKIQNLKKVTNQLKKNANFNEALKKLDLQTFDFPFSRETKFPNREELDKILKDILDMGETEEEAEFKAYCIMILRLEKLQRVGYLDDSTIDKEIQNLIRSSYPSIPAISFAK